MHKIVRNVRGSAGIQWSILIGLVIVNGYQVYFYLLGLIVSALGGRADAN
jgi:hypothetical protein